MNSFIIDIFIALALGIVPVLFWLWFWEHEDKHPEPRRLVFIAFIAGTISVVAALILEHQICTYITAAPYTCNYPPPPYILFLWAVVEELVKFLAAYLVVLNRAENDEPVDSMMYMITVALGFSALENVLFLYFGPVNDNSSLALVATTENMRFIGANLVHLVSSGVIGLAFALGFYKKIGVRLTYTLIGVITAIFLHTMFNLSIIIFDGTYRILPFALVWLSVIGIILAFEKVKSITKPTP